MSNGTNELDIWDRWDTVPIVIFTPATEEKEFEVWDIGNMCPLIEIYETGVAPVVIRRRLFIF